MNEQSVHDAEGQTDQLLRELGQRGDLDNLDDSTLDRLLSKSPSITVSADLKGRALSAMAKAQSEREQGNPAVALGVIVSQARQQTGQEISSIAQRAGMSEDILKAFEQGGLSLRQIITQVTPRTAARLLVQLHIAQHRFSHLLLKLAEGGMEPRRLAARINDHRRSARTAAIEEVADYIAALEQAALAERPSEP